MEGYDVASLLCKEFRALYCRISKDMKDEFTIWKDRVSQLKQSLSHMQDNWLEVSRLKKSIFTLYAGLSDVD